MTDDINLLTHDVADEEAKERIDRLLARVFPDLSRSRIKALIEAGHVTVNGEVMTDASQKVNAHDHLTLDLPPAEDPTPQGEDIPLDILFEDEAIIVINKPSGLVVHPGAGNWTGTLVNALIAHCGDTLSGIGGVRRPGIVHRLDKDTTGVMVVAKTDVAHRLLSRQFADHGRSGPLRRAYLAFVWGRPPRDKFTINEPIDRSTGNREKMAIRALGREAITHVEVLESYPDAKEPVCSLVRCSLETGRTHQIRVHMAHIGFPLLGDEVYGNAFKTKITRLPPQARQALEALGRQALHAAVLGFEHPISRTPVYYECGFPADLQRLKDCLTLFT